MGPMGCSETSQVTLFLNCLVLADGTDRLSRKVGNIYAVQQGTQSVLMSEFIQHLC